MLGKLSLRFLELIVDVSGDAIDHFAGFLEAGYGASARSMEYHARYGTRTKGSESLQRKMRRSYAVMLHRLKKDGLLAEVSKNGKRLFVLTKEGSAQLENFSEQGRVKLSTRRYKLEQGGRALIITFDIPEKDRRKRSWLRSVLKNMGLSMIQQSVWVGKGRVPRSFIDDLEHMQLMDCVEIFEITKTGSLESIT